MSDLPPSSPKVTSTYFEGSPDDLLQQGLAALKQKDYDTAVQYLSKLPQDQTAAGAVRLKARIGLVKALNGQGQLAPAIALCRPLTTHSQTKVQQWAITTLAALEQRAAIAQPAALSPPAESSTAADLSGFQPLESSPQPTVSARSATPPPETAAVPPPLGSDLSGFQPLNPEDAPSGAAAKTAATTPDEASNPPVGTPARKAEKATQIQSDEGPLARSEEDRRSRDQQDDAVAPQQSLFHYEHLNQMSLPTTDAGLVGDADNASDSAAVPPASAQDEPPLEPAQPLQFREAERLERLRPLPKDGQTLWPVWGSQLISAIALFWLCRALVQVVLSQVARLLDLFSGIVRLPLGWRDQEHTVLVVSGFIALLLASPWLLDWLFKQTADLKSLSIQTLKQTHPESCRLLRRIGQKRSWILPTLRELPTEAPLIFSYGWLPRYSRIVISRGLLTRLDDDELATLMGYELTHLTTWTLPFMSLVSVLLQLTYQLYWQTAQWGDRRPDRLTKALAALVSAVGYALYWVLRKLLVPCSRSRVLGCDRQAVEWTGNPNALVRALVKLADGIAETLAKTGYTPPLVESTDLMTPGGYTAFITLGSLYPEPSFLSALQWDIQNPYRRWLSINSSHPRLGERLKRLAGYAWRWQLTPALPFPESGNALRSPQATFQNYWLPFLQQISPYIGPLLGVAIAMLLWFLGGIFEPLGLQRVAWVYGDRSVLWGSLLLGLGMGIMVRINPYFPDITASNRDQHPWLPDLLSAPMALPTDSQPIRLEGTLLGRRGMANWLCQDLILKTPSGLLKLHFLSILGALGNLLIHPQHPTDWVGRQLDVQGWYRRGAIAWMDVDCFFQAGKVVTRANHPMFAVLLSLGFCALGLFVLIRG